jgi:hypothetical protein
MFFRGPRFRKLLRDYIRLIVEIASILLLIYLFRLFF